MPRPTPQDRHVDGVLSNVGMAFFQDPRFYVSGRVFPRAPVPKQSDKFRTYSLSELLRLRAQKINPGQPAPQDTGTFSDDTFFCEKYGLGDFLTPEDIANDDGPIPPEEVLINALMQGHLTDMEIRWAATYFTTGVWAKDWQGVAAAPGANEYLQFDATSADPVETITQARRERANAVGETYAPNVAVIGGEVWDHMQTNAAIQDRIKYTGQPGAKVTTQMLASLFQVEEVLVAGAIYNSAAENATASMTQIFGKSILMAYRTRTPSPRIPSAGYTFVWNQPSDAPAGLEVVVRKIPRPEMGNRTDYEAIQYWDQKLCSSALGIYLYDVIS